MVDTYYAQHFFHKQTHSQLSINIALRLKLITEI